MEKKLRQVTDSIHGTIYLSDLESELISTPYFYRLHDIYQSSTVYMTFPSNRTKRYEHSLGTMALASRILFSSVTNAETKTRDLLFGRLKDYFLEIVELINNGGTCENLYFIKNKDKVEELFDTVGDTNDFKVFIKYIKESVKLGDFADSALDYYQFYPMENMDSTKDDNAVNIFLYRCLLQAVRVVALFHDVGHPPFSHIIENTLKELYALVRVDIYDINMSFLKSIDLSTVSNDDNELRQGVSFFEASNDYIYYENFSITRYLGLSTNGELNQVIETSELFSKASETGFNKNTKLFCEIFSENNKLYLFDVTDNTLMQADFEIEDDRYYIISLARNAHDKILISMYYKDPDTGETLEPRLYYFKLSDLEFENLN